MILSLGDINVFDNAKDFLVDARELSDERMVELQNITTWDEPINSIVFHMYINSDGYSSCDISVFDGEGGWKDNIEATNEEINQVHDFLVTISDYCNL